MAVKWQKKDAHSQSAAQMLAQNGTAVFARPDAESQYRVVRQLMDDCPGEEMLWLVPQRRLELRREQLRREGVTLPECVQLLACEQLAEAAPEQWAALAARQPKIAVLDSYQELSARCWEASVHRLLRFCPGLALLGVTEPNAPAAGCREAEDLFREAVGSRSTLAETLVRGDLPAPKPLAVLLWPWREALDAVRPYGRSLYVRGQSCPCAEQWEQLSRAVERGAPAQAALLASLLPEDGRFVAVCENEAAAQLLSQRAGDLLQCEPEAVRCYRVPAHELRASEAWQSFYADEAPGRKILICLNEPGVELPMEKIDGALLLRESGAAFGSMLSRALAICGTAVPVVDVCMSLDAMGQAQLLRTKCRAAAVKLGEKGTLFALEEPLRRCGPLFRLLEESMEQEWDRFYEEAQAYAAEHGNLDVQRGEATESGRMLGRWLERQRQDRAAGRLSAERIAQMDALNFDWKQPLGQSWERGYVAAAKYRAQHRDLLVPVRYVDADGFALGEWIVYNRQRYIGGNLSAERVERLAALGMVWNTAENLWEQSYAAALQYYVEHGDLLVPVKYTTPDGMALGVWMCSQRAAYRAHELSNEQIAWLDALGMDWSNRNDRRWQQTYQAAVRYRETRGDLDVPAEYVDEDGVMLGKWICRQRYALQNPDRSSARVTPERKALLDELGMIWEQGDPWQERYQMVLDYRAAHNGRPVPSLYKTEDGIWLGSWLARQRLKLQRGESLTPEQRAALLALFQDEAVQKSSAGTKPSVRELNWQENYRRARAYAKQHGDLLVPASYVDETGCRLGVWISNLRAARKNRPDSFQVTPEHIALLDAIGMQWDAREAKWACAMRRAEEYRAEHGDLRVPVNYKTADGFCLGDWIRRVRESQAAGDPKLTADRIAALDALGMVWKTKRA